MFSSSRSAVAFARTTRSFGSVAVSTFCSVIASPDFLGLQRNAQIQCTCDRKHFSASIRRRRARRCPRSPRGAPAPTSSRSPADGGARVDAGPGRVDHSVRRRRLASSLRRGRRRSARKRRRARRSRSRRGRGEPTRPAGRARRRVERVQDAAAPSRGPLQDAVRMDRALAHAELDHRDEERSVGVGHRCEHAAEEPRADARLRCGAAARVVQARPDRARPQTPPARRAVPGDDPSRLARAEHHRPSAAPTDARTARRGSRSRGRRDASPGRARGAGRCSVEHHERIGVEGVPAKPPPFGSLRRPAPRPWVRDADVDAARRRRRRRVPGSAAACVGVRPGIATVSKRQTDPAGARVERVDGAPPARREADVLRVHAPARRDRRDVDELLRPRRRAACSRGGCPCAGRARRRSCRSPRRRRPQATATPFGPSLRAV